MVRLLVWAVKSILGVAQLAILSRVAERTGLRHTWIHPVAAALSDVTRLNVGFLEVLVLAGISCWLVWVLSALCACLSASLCQVTGISPARQYPSRAGRPSSG